LSCFVIAAVTGGDAVASLLQGVADGGADAARTSGDESYSPHVAFLPLGALYGRFAFASRIGPATDEPREASKTEH
jgi:hypothetical protein